MGKSKVVNPDTSVTINLDPGTVALMAAIYPNELTRSRVQRLVAQAGANTFLAQVAGLNVPSAMSELRLARIYWLMQAGMTIDEAEDTIAKLFRVPPSVARRLNSAAIARYAGAELVDGNLLKSVQAALNEAAWNKDKKRWVMQLPASLVRARVWQELGRHTWPNPERGDGASWKFPNDTYQRLRGVFQLQETPPPA
jgi:hypothetical protein